MEDVAINMSSGTTNWQCDLMLKAYKSSILSGKKPLAMNLLPHAQRRGETAKCFVC